MKVIEHKSRMRYLLGHNPTGELVRVITHQFTTGDSKNRITLEKMARCLKLSKED